VILIDTNIIIDYLEGSYPLDNLFDTEEAATCGIVLAELLHGVKSIKEKKMITEALSEFHWINIEESLWETVGSNLNILKKAGLNLPFQDAVLAAMCIKNKISLLSNDRHFEKIAEILTDLSLYKFDIQNR
jgi:predicted nucleic acid-binding protein